jgi:type VI secretion system protein ImpA
MDQDLFNRLIAPIPGDHPCGEDASFSVEFDEIREARRQDDPSLAQGDWEAELKTAQWPKVRQLCENILQSRSKDLQIACWYTDALTHLHGFQGLTFGLEVLEVLVTDFFEFFYPGFDPDNLDERAGKIEWLNKQLSVTVRNVPLTSKTSGAYAWLKWEESRTVDNLGLKDAAAKDKAIASGKLAGDAFDKAVTASGLPFYQALESQIHAARTRLQAVEKHIDERFGAESSGLKDLRSAVADCDDLVGKLIIKLGGKAEFASPHDDEPHDQTTSQEAPTPQALPIGQIRTRADAVAALRQVSQFFKANEPHSPVALLADRAAKWAEMPLESWLASVIKDDATLSQLRELLDVQ